MNDLRALAHECGAVSYTPGPMRAVRGVSMTFEQLEAFAARVRADASTQTEKSPREGASMPDGWSVFVEVAGDRLVCIEQNAISGKLQLSEAEEETIVGAALHLLAFVGAYPPLPTIQHPDHDRGLSWTSAELLAIHAYARAFYDLGRPAAGSGISDAQCDALIAAVQKHLGGWASSSGNKHTEAVGKARDDLRTLLAMAPATTHAPDARAAWSAFERLESDRREPQDTERTRVVREFLMRAAGAGMYRPDLVAKAATTQAQEARFTVDEVHQALLDYGEYSDSAREEIISSLGKVAAPTTQAQEAVPLQHFDSPRAQVLMRTWQEGWEACRDAEFVGEEAQNDAFNRSNAVNHCIAEDRLHSAPTQPQPEHEPSPANPGDFGHEAGSGRYWSPPDSFGAAWLTNNAALHPATVDLVVRFARALAGKLAAAEVKYGYSDGWLSPDWIDECKSKLRDHIAKGDPRDVAAYCAFLWHHGATTILDWERAGTDYYQLEHARRSQRPTAERATSERVYLVATGELHEGQETYTRHANRPPPLCDAELLFTAPTASALRDALEDA